MVKNACLRPEAWACRPLSSSMLALDFVISSRSRPVARRFVTKERFLRSDGSVRSESKGGNDSVRHQI